MKYVYSIIFILLFSPVLFSEISAGDNKKEAQFNIRLNTRETFKKIKKNDMVAILVGNDAYRKESGCNELVQCINDTRLISKVLTVCCKVPEVNIHIVTNCTKEEFLKTFNDVIRNLKDEQSVFISFSGHGDTDGSLIFVDGSRISPDELKKMINSFHHDTVLIIDACYSGNNEGPLDPGEDGGFRDNCTRIYASLAHMTAKEITYDNEYFKAIKPFYEEVLGLKDISGNGYFTSFIGYFFAEFQFDTSGNISFKDMLNYITNKGKQYTEYLAMRGARNIEVTYDYYSQSAIRLNQVPKIFPLDKEIKYENPNHEFMVIRKYIEPFGLIGEVSYAPFFCIGVSGDNKNDLFKFTWSHSLSARVAYSPNFFRGFLAGIETGYMYTYRDRDEEKGQQEVVLHIVPVMGIAGYRQQLDVFNKNLFIRYIAGAGVAVCTWDFKEYDIINRELYNTSDFCYQLGAGVALQVSKELFISLDVQYFGISFSGGSSLAGLRFPFGISYRF